jgi:putative membrane protein
MNKKTNSFHQAWLEIKERLFSSKTRILKTIGMCIVPFIYAFICIAAF